MKIKREITINKSTERKWINSSIRPGAPPAGPVHPETLPTNPVPVHPETRRAEHQGGGTR